MSCTTQETEQVITLKGSTDIVTEFFFFSINSILYQRGIYPAESFSKQQKYGLTMMTTEDMGLKAYLDNVIKQMHGKWPSKLCRWMLRDEVQRLVLVISGVESGEALERWAFHVQGEPAPAPLKEASGNAPAPRKSQKDICNEIQAIIRQITASVTFLPLLSEPCAFDLLVYTNKSATVPIQWEESDPRYIADSSQVKLRSFSTKVHKVDTLVAFRNQSDAL
ncbi:DNA-binding protein [Tribonema minus]|uniref:DNA-binding protein n=1 Tax=Tribonema minus TaxID=303371 RepID=A0A836CIY9_9STRA|nr:DNA-binding protein [Tribonema minus]